MLHQFKPEQKSKLARERERRRLERERRENELRRRIDRLRRRIVEARKRRQRLLLTLLLALLLALEAMRPKILLSTYWPDSALNPSNWMPDPSNDYAAAQGEDDHCDGYSYEQWTRMMDKRGIKLSRKAEMKAAWDADPERELFPERYQLWGHRPYIGQIMDDLTAPYWRQEAFEALKLLTPAEVHGFLDDGYAAGSTFRLCRAERDADIVKNFRIHASFWEEGNRREVEEARKSKNNPKPDGEEEKFEP